MLPPVRQLFPIPVDDVDPTDVYASVDRPGPRHVLINMIASLDGATAVEGRSGGLGGAADKRAFAAIRKAADVILVGAGTVRAEDYGPPKAEGVRLAIVTSSLDLDPGARVFSDGHRPLVITTADADPDRRAALARVSDVLVAGTGQVDLHAAIDQLEGVILCEGGPSLNGQLVADGLVDELCVTIAPLLAGGRSARLAHGLAPAAPEAMALAHVLEEDGYLFLRYVRSSP